MNEGDSIGARLAELRTERGLTLQQLADRCGLSVSFLSQLERDKVNVSVANLKKIASALEANVTTFFHPDSEQPEGKVTRASARRKLTLTEAGWQIEALLPQNGGRLEAFLVCAESGSADNSAYPHHGEEFSMVLEGTVCYTLGEEVYTLQPGDTIYHKSNVPHRWKNIGEGEAVVLTVATPPAF